MSSFAETNDFKRVLVLGSKKVGKTSLLSAISSREFDDDYYKTKKIDKFWDIQRRLEFIDTPGLDDKILELMPLTDKPILNMEEDPEIQEIFMAGRKLGAIGGYMLVYAQEDHVTKIMVEQLLSVVVQVPDSGKATKIWVVENEGNIMRVKQFDTKRLPKKGKRGTMKEICEKAQASFFSVNVKTNKKIEDLLDKIAEDLDSRKDLNQLFPNTSTTVNSTTARKGCDVPSCVVM